MRRRTRWVVSVLVAATVGAVALRCLVPPKLALTQSDLTLRSLPLVPSQPTTATLECTRGLVGAVPEIGGDWFLTRDHPPCTVGGDLLGPIKATAAEMAVLKHRPRVVFHVTANGQISNASVSRTSGSETLDERSLTLVLAHRYKRHNCGVCRVSTEVDVDFQGPVWIRDSVR
jgi:hypothetical protein